jgi:hypothetical protein
VKGGFGAEKVRDGELHQNISDRRRIEDVRVKEAV